jgi:hypothetical protein
VGLSDHDSADAPAMVRHCLSQHARIDDTHQIVNLSLSAVSSQENTSWRKSNDNISFFGL